ncbi:MAG: hypothetical protein ACLQPD_16880 [Desulfomonilaceae bacterium]
MPLDRREFLNMVAAKRSRFNPRTTSLQPVTERNPYTYWGTLV